MLLVLYETWCLFQAERSRLYLFQAGLDCVYYLEVNLIILTIDSVTLAPVAAGAAYVEGGNPATNQPPNQQDEGREVR